MIVVFVPYVASDAASHRPPAPPAPPAEADRGATAVPAWIVETAPDHEIFSNGLRIENRFAVTTRPRSYLVFDPLRPDAAGGERQSVPAGIVFHTTESHQAPFLEDENRRLREIAESLLGYVREKRAYHFVIDRFGRVFRVVAEEDVAYHAGYSVWADSRRLYLDLNSSFLGVAFEAQSAASDPPVNPAQIRSGTELVQMLRGKYGIPAGNCITHAQVSVNPANMRAGYHTDFASRFPFEKFSLPDNYAAASPALWLFGFECDEVFRKVAEHGAGRAVDAAEEQIRAEAALRGITVSQYRAILQARYRSKHAALGGGNSSKEKQHEQQSELSHRS